MTTTLSQHDDTHSQAYQQYNKFMNMQQPEVAKHIKVYLNGNGHFPGRRFVVNRRYISDFNGFLNQVTVGIKAPFGAVRNIYTPKGGHRVEALQELHNGMDLVAGGVERFRRLEYRDIAIRQKPSPKKNPMDIANRRKMEVSARWQKESGRPKTIYVYANNDINRDAKRVLLRPKSLRNIGAILEEVNEKVIFNSASAVSRLYDMDFKKVTTPEQLVNGSHYVAVSRQPLVKLEYGSLNSLARSPRRNNAPLPPINRTRRPRPPAKEDDGQTYTKMYARKKFYKEEETVMGASAATGYKPLTTKKYRPQKPPGPPPSQEAESVFHAKPVKVKRSGGGRAPVLLATTNDEGVFRNDVNNIKADEVEEDEDTKVDLPIDQVPADVVEDEVIVAVSSKDNLAEENNINDVTESEHVTDLSSRQNEEENKHDDTPQGLEEHPAPAPSSGFPVNEEEEEIPEVVEVEKPEEKEDLKDEVIENNVEESNESPEPQLLDPQATEEETKVFEAGLQVAASETNQARSSSPLDGAEDQSEDPSTEPTTEEVKENEVDQENNISETEDIENVSVENKQRVVPGLESNEDVESAPVDENENKATDDTNKDDVTSITNEPQEDVTSNRGEEENKVEDAPADAPINEEDDQIVSEDVENNNTKQESIDENQQETENDVTEPPVVEPVVDDQPEQNKEEEQIVQTPSSPRPPSENPEQVVSKPSTPEQNSTKEDPSNDQEDKEEQEEEDNKQQDEEQEKAEDGSQLSAESTARPASEAVTDDEQQNEQADDITTQEPNEVKHSVGNGIAHEAAEAES